VTRNNETIVSNAVHLHDLARYPLRRLDPLRPPPRIGRRGHPFETIDTARGGVEHDGGDKRLTEHHLSRADHLAQGHPSRAGRLSTPEDILERIGWKRRPATTGTLPNHASGNDLRAHRFGEQLGVADLHTHRPHRSRPHFHSLQHVGEAEGTRRHAVDPRELGLGGRTRHHLEVVELAQIHHRRTLRFENPHLEPRSILDSEDPGIELYLEARFGGGGGDRGGGRHRG